jgi:heme/copper-type cytochrome/quinol oxidase subunit 3
VTVTRPTIDVTHLPPTAFDTRAPVWWGNTLMMFIETTTVALLVLTYFYVWQNFPQWPPPRVNEETPIERPLPDLPAGTANAVLLLVSCVATYQVDTAARKKRRAVVIGGLAFLTLLGVASLVLRGFEFPAVKFRWDENAYASVVWWMLVLHLVYILLAVAECGILAYWIARYGLDTKHAVDVTLTGIYWYWMAGVGVVLYGVIYWAPRVL